MGKDIGLFIGDPLSKNPTRRDLLRTGVAVGLSAAILPPLRAPASAESTDEIKRLPGVPFALSEAFTNDPEVVHSVPDVVDIAAVADRYGNSILYTLSVDSHGSTVSKTGLDPTTDKYTPFAQCAAPKVDIPTTITTLPRHDANSAETVLVGGFDLDDRDRSRNAALSLSNDGGNSFKHMPIWTARGEIIEGSVLQLERIPDTNKAIFAIGFPDEASRQYGIFDANT